MQGKGALRFCAGYGTISKKTPDCDPKGLGEAAKKRRKNHMEQYGIRREAVLRAMAPESMLVLYAGKSVPASMDETYPFEANRHFFYLTGIRRENMALVLSRTGDGEKAVLFIEEPVASMERWTGRRMTREEAQQVSGIGDVRYIDGLQDYLSRLLTRESVSTAYFDCYRNALGDADSYNMARAKAFAAQCPAVALRDAHPLVSALRMRKDDQEIGLMRRAIELTDKGLRRVLSRLAPGQMEYQMQAEFEYEIRRNGAEGTAFPTIAGSGLNGCMLHYGTNHCEMKPDTLLLMDLGAKYGGYCADITRTYPVSGRYTPRQKEIYDIVLSANRAVAKAARPGMTLAQLNDLCKQVLADGLLRLGKIKDASEIGAYYMHGVSHHLGIDTHDVTVAAQAELAPGMVITDEPGLYIDEEAIGIRIEDDLLITQDGCEVLSEAIPRTTEEIEAIMKG